MLAASALVGTYVSFRFLAAFLRDSRSRQAGTWGLAFVSSMLVVGLIDADLLPALFLVIQLVIAGLATWDAHRLRLSRAA